MTFNRDVAPIIFENCSTCHRPGQPAPFSLLNYADVRKHGDDVATVTAARYMPPWLPDPTEHPFADSRRLPDAQIKTIQQWVASGMPEGDAEDLPKVPAFTDGWQLGNPDLVVRMPEPFLLPASGKDVYRNFVVPLPVEGKRYVRAVEFKADTKALHHVFFYFDRTRQSERVDQQDMEPGFAGMGLPPGVSSPPGHFLSWQPGRGPTLSPPGLSWPIEAGSVLMQAHMQPVGKPEPVQASIAFYFTDQPPTNTPFKLALDSYRIDVPAGASNVVVEDSYTLPVDVDVVSVLPHAHYLGRKIEGFALRPDGKTETLLKIDRWDFNWQSDFRYIRPVPLPKGSRLVMRWTYDNSTNNLRNPNTPPQRVRYGVQSSDEMGELYFQVLTRSAADLSVLQEDYKWQVIGDIIEFNTWALGQNRTNAHAHVQLGKALLALNKRAEATTHFRRALGIDAKQEEGRYHLGLVLMDANPQAAEREFREALAINPENYKARANLGVLLMQAGRLEEAETEFKAGLAANPNDPLLIENLAVLARKKAGNP